MTALAQIANVFDFPTPKIATKLREMQKKLSSNLKLSNKYPEKSA
jgi:hypothetical protein